MKRGKSTGYPVRPLISLAFLVLFLWSLGKTPFFPSLRLLEDTQWDPSLFFPAWGRRLLSFLWIVPAGLGFLGWGRWFEDFFFPKMEKGTSILLGLSLSLSVFSLFVFALAVNALFYRPLTALFFLPTLGQGWKEWKELSFGTIRPLRGGWVLFGIAAALVWISESLAAPLAWDAILDHFRYAREVSRLHQLPFHWVNHTGDMPKAAELILAGFWNLGGEDLSKFSLALPALLTGWLLILFSREAGDGGRAAIWIFWTCPFFFALYAFGYVEGFLAYFEVLGLFCLWKGLKETKGMSWLPLAAFLFGFAVGVKYTAVMGLAAAGLIWGFLKLTGRNSCSIKWIYLAAFLIPVFPWFFKNWLAFGNPFYPFLTSIFGAAVGYSPEMERGLLADTGVPWGQGTVQFLKTLWDSFFTASNQVNAPWTPLVVMSLPWVFGALKNKLGSFLLAFALLFLTEWVFVSSSLRHACAGTLVLVILAGMAWNKAFQEKGGWGKPLFGLGAVLSLWLCLSTQLTTTAPYASALGLEDNLLRLQRHYSYSTDTYQAYRWIEDHSDPYDRVVAFAVWQTYPLDRTAFVDFKWKKPILLEWASHCQTAEQLAKKFHEEGVRYLLYQHWEAEAMSKMEKDFELTGMPVSEYSWFWRSFADPVFVVGNAAVCQIRDFPMPVSPGLNLAPGLLEKQSNP